MENRIKELEARMREFKEDLKVVEKRLSDKDIADAVLREQLNVVVETTSRIEEKIDKREEKPQKLFDDIISTSLKTVVGAIIGALIVLIMK